MRLLAPHPFLSFFLTTLSFLFFPSSLLTKEDSEFKTIPYNHSRVLRMTEFENMRGASSLCPLSFSHVVATLGFLTIPHMLYSAYSRRTEERLFGCHNGGTVEIEMHRSLAIGVNKRGGLENKR